MPDETLGRLLERAAGSGKGVRFVDRNETARFYGYAELLDRARRTGAGLARLGVRPADRVAIILPTGPDFYDAFFGAVLIGAVPAPLYPPVRLGRLREYRAQTAALLRGCGARVVVTDGRVARVTGRAVAEAEPPLGLATVGDLRALGGGPRGGLIGVPDPRAAALIQHSSGTTGRPRPIRVTHRAVIANLNAIRARLLAVFPDDAEREHAAVSWLPLYHDMGLIGCVLTAMAHPADLTLIPPELFVARPGVWLRAISRYRATVSGAPNFAYSYCADRISDEEIEGLDLSTWLVALNGAEPVTAGAMDRFARRFGPCGLRPEALTPVYGLAEATLAVTFSDPESRPRQVSLDRDALAREGVARPTASGGATLISVGRPLPGIRLRIAPETGSRGAPGGEEVLGRVLVSGPSMFDGYDDDDPLGEGPAPPGPDGPWFDTGDTGFLLDGELYLYGRARDVLVLRGCKYAPHPVEEALDDVEGVRTGCVAAIGVPLHEGEEERLVVLAERARGRPPRDDAALAAQAVRAVAERTDLVCGRVLILEPGTLPRTSSGKIRRAEARRRYTQGQLSPPARRQGMALIGEAVGSGLAVARMRRRRRGPATQGDSS